jgi:tRNA(Ile)-lysidine synthase
MPGILFEKFIRSVNRHHLLDRGDSVLVAVSGGADSVALLYLLCEVSHQFHLQLGVAHYNHRLRGRESDDDEEFVRMLAQKKGVDFHCGGDTKLQLKSANLEDQARQLRFEFLLEIAQKIKSRKIALGHTGDDQAETFMIRLLRGSGSTGLSGIPPIREGLWIRPLLTASRQDILTYLRGKNIGWREDSSNATDDYLRNRVRHHLLPLLEKEYNPNLRATLMETANTLREESEALKILADALVVKKTLPGDKLELSLDEINPQPIGLRAVVVREILRHYSPAQTFPSLKHVRAVLDLMSPGKSGKKIETSHFMVQRTRHSIIFSPNPPQIP